MTLIEALQAIESFRSMGWSFKLSANSYGWECKAIGAGLAHATCGGQSLEEAVAITLSHARAMEDDPEVVIRRYATWIRRNVEEVFGPGTFRGIKTVEAFYDRASKSLSVAVFTDCSTTSVTIDREAEFYRRLIGQPMEILMALRIKKVWPESITKS